MATPDDIKIYDTVVSKVNKTPKEVQKIIESFHNETGGKSKLTDDLLKERSKVFITFYETIAYGNDSELLNVDDYDKYHAALLNVYGLDLKGASQSQLRLTKIQDIRLNEPLNIRQGRRRIVLE